MPGKELLQGEVPTQGVCTENFSFVASPRAPRPRKPLTGEWVRKEDSIKKLQAEKWQCQPGTIPRKVLRAQARLQVGLLGAGCHLAASVRTAGCGAPGKVGR